MIIIQTRFILNCCAIRSYGFEVFESNEDKIRVNSHPISYASQDESAQKVANSQTNLLCVLDVSL